MVRRAVALACVFLVACLFDASVGERRDDRRVDLGGGIVATFSTEGALVVMRGDAVVLKSARLASSVSDPERPDAWHDPAKAEGFAPVAAAAVELEAVSGALHIRVNEQPAGTALVRLSFDADDGFYGGLGERFDHANARGRVVPMHLAVDGDNESGTNEAHVPVPFFVSSRGYGVFVKTHEAGAFDVAATNTGKVHATFEGRALEAFVYVDEDPLAIVARFARETGLPRAMPAWALAPMHWRNEWSDGDQPIADAMELRKRKIPASCLWIDNPWQTAYNTHRFDTKRFADPPAMMAKLAALGFRTLAWSTPYLEKPAASVPRNEAHDLYEEADRQKLLVRFQNGDAFAAPAQPVKQTGGGMIDFTSAEARAFWTRIVDRATDAGFRGYKIDYGEELVPNLFGARPNFRFSDGTTERSARRYPVLEHRAYHDSLDRTEGGVLVVRASSYGGAAQADIVWPGDLDNGFERAGDRKDGGRAVGGLPAAVVAAQTLATSGFPAFGSDTGGYRGGKPAREALLRWAEHTALSVILQLGGAGSDHNPWTYDEEASAIYAELARLHQQLVPYLAGLMRGARERGVPTIRSLPLAYPRDAASIARADDEYMLGPDLLVAPVVSAGAVARDVHLPEGTWVGFWDDRALGGPLDLRVDAPLGKPPLYARAGAIVPLTAPDVDTMVEASEPGIVTASARAGEAWARAWVKGNARLESDAGVVAIVDGAGEIEITWTPRAPATALVLDVVFDGRRERVRISGAGSAHVKR